MNKWAEIVLGLILIIVAVLLWILTLGLGGWDFGTAALEFLKGGIVWFIILLGLLFLMLGISDLRG